MMNLPRALVGPLRAMARPTRPMCEVAAVREAADIIRRESGPSTNHRLAKEIALRVVAKVLREVEQPTDEPFVSALAALEQRYAPSPFVTLATCPEIDTMSEFVERRIRRVRSRAGRYLSSFAQAQERAVISADLVALLTHRYCRHLRRNIR